MKRFLLVGCGGSGGATLAYMMDHLKALLRTRGISHLPGGWQFIHVDVPVSPDSPPDRLPNVQQSGGRYVAMGSSISDYAVLDRSVSERLGPRKNALGLIGSWAPKRPEAVTVPVAIGAGQYRAVGRMITLGRTKELRDSFKAAHERLEAEDARKGLTDLARAFSPQFGSYSGQDPPIVLVIASMGGGSGASMALEVCRLLSRQKGFNADHIGVFMFTADTFESIPATSRTGVAPNALAMLGEIIAAQVGAASKDDADLLDALIGDTGQAAEIPFARVFPVSRRIGGLGAILGEGRPKDLYRALGRGLASLMTSGDVALTDFVQYDLGNSQSGATETRYFGWGTNDPSSLSWNSFGFASLSTGRDRYAHYAAQRLAGTCVDRLLDGHLVLGSTAPSSDQVNLLLDSQWDTFLDRLGLPRRQSTPGANATFDHWFKTAAMPAADVERSVETIISRDLEASFPSPDGKQMNVWKPMALRRLAEARPKMREAVQKIVVASAWVWHKRLEASTKQVVCETVARFGIPFTIAALKRTEGHILEDLVPFLAQTVEPVADPTALPQTLDDSFDRIRGVVKNGRKFIEHILWAVRRNCCKMTQSAGAKLWATVLETYAIGVLRPLTEGLTDSLRVLETAREQDAPSEGMADLATTFYKSWPSDNDERPHPRFTLAVTEVPLTDAQEFPNRYRSDLWNALGQPDAGQTLDEVRSEVLAQVLRGEWETTSSSEAAPGGLLEEAYPWRSAAFPVDPDGQPIVQSPAVFRLHVAPEEVLDRASRFVRRPGESFAMFLNTTLRDYVRGSDAPNSPSIRGERENKVERAFLSALEKAHPLVGASAQAVLKLHPDIGSIKYRYKFSSVPFQGSIDQRLAKALEDNRAIDPTTLTAFTAAVDASDARQISIFCSYDKYAPLAFDSVLDPIAEQWQSSSQPARREFWTWRRARTLSGALPMSDTERHSMTAGWMVAQIIGDLYLPDREHLADPVKIWSDDAGRWLSFPNPLLTPPSTPGFKSFDWLPAVLESILLAIAHAPNQPVFSSLEPYAALRGKYDSQDQPTAGQASLAGLKLLANWLRTGSSNSGGSSLIDDANHATDLTSRTALAKAWVDEASHIAAHYTYRESAQGSTADAIMMAAVYQVNSRPEAATMPLFADLAQDVSWACRKVSELIDKAAKLPAAGPIDNSDDSGFDGFVF